MKRIILLVILLVYSNLFPVAAQNSTVLFVLSAEDTLSLNKGQMKRQTGVFLNEFYISYKAVISNGYSVEFATPNGIKATIDKESLEEKYWKDDLSLKSEAYEFWNNNIAFSNPITIEKAIERSDDFIGVVFPGGQGLMVDLFYDPNIPVLLKAFASKEKAIGLICHAPVLIATIPKEENPFIGYTFNSVTPFEEFFIETFVMKGKPKNRKIARQLKKLGLQFEKGWPGKGYAVRDRNLVTSQNPISGKEFNNKFLTLLKEYE